MKSFESFRPSEPGLASTSRIGLAYHEEMARAVHNRDAAFSVRSIRSIQRRWPGSQIFGPPSQDLLASVD
jgi:hypothetical protein